MAEDSRGKKNPMTPASAVILPLIRSIRILRTTGLYASVTYSPAF